MEDLLRLSTARAHGERVKCAFPGPQQTHSNCQDYLRKPKSKALVQSTAVGHHLLEVARKGYLVAKEA